MQHKGRIYGALICLAMREAASLRRRPETKTDKYYITASGGRVTNIPGDDYLQDCYESMRSRVDKRTVNVKLIAGFHRRTSLKGEDEQCGVVEEVEVIGRSDSSGPLAALINCLRQVAAQICKWLKATQKKKSKREGNKDLQPSPIRADTDQNNMYSERFCRVLKYSALLVSCS